MLEQTAAIYCRLSKEDLDKEPGKTVSESIKNQRALLDSYAKERQWTVYDYYIDEDFSGSDRERPAFNRLIADSLLGRFGIVLCKKQARFARDIEYVEKYIHGLFSERRIRFVAVLDNIDTGMISRSVRKASQINSLIDEWYLSDLSDSILSSLDTKRKNAEFIGSWAPYGYRKDPANKNRLIIDTEAASIIKSIFLNYQDGMGSSRIARELNRKQIPNPLHYKHLSGERINPCPEHLSEKRYLWSPSTVSSILHNATYHGALIQGKFRKAGYKSKKLLRVPKDRWIIIEGSHDAIIEDTLWQSVQNKLSACRRFPAGLQQHPLTGKVFCAVCGSRMVSTGGRYGSRNTSYLCCSRHRLSPEACVGSRIQQSRLEVLLLNQLQALWPQLYDQVLFTGMMEQKIQDMKTNLQDGKKAHSNGMTELSYHKSESDSAALKIRRIEDKFELLYADRLNGLISEQQFAVFKKKLDQESTETLLVHQNIQDTIAGCQPSEQQADCSTTMLNSGQCPDHLSIDMAEQMLKSVLVGRRRPDHTQAVTINWNF